MKEQDFEPSIIKSKVLKLCRRLRHCTLDDLTTFLETDVAIIETALLYLEQVGEINILNGTITPNSDFCKKPKAEKKNLALMKEFIDDEKLDLISQL